MEAVRASPLNRVLRSTGRDNSRGRKVRSREAVQRFHSPRGQKLEAEGEEEAPLSLPEAEEPRSLSQAAVKAVVVQAWPRWLLPMLWAARKRAVEHLHDRPPESRKYRTRALQQQPQQASFCPARANAGGECFRSSKRDAMKSSRKANLTS